MARWVRSALVVLCVVAVCGEARQRWQSDCRQRHNRHRTWLSGRRCRPDRRRPTVPEPAHRPQEDPTLQVQRLWNNWMNNTQSDQPQPQRSVFRLKHQLSSRAGVDQLRKAGPEHAFDGFGFMNDAGSNYDFRDERILRVVDLITDIRVNHSCGEPARQLVRVSDEHPSSSAIYTPPSVLVRRCGDQTGCCTADSDTCAPANVTTVTITVMVYNAVRDTSQRFESLKFVEHTKCHCVRRSRRSTNNCPHSIPVNDASVPVEQKIVARHGKRRGSHSHTANRGKTCRCTSEFASRPLPDGSCKCDCFDGNRKCKRQRRGGSHLSETDNRCIVTGNCDPPDCKYGTFRMTHGRCPRWKGEWHRLRFTV